MLDAPDENRGLDWITLGSLPIQIHFGQVEGGIVIGLGWHKGFQEVEGSALVLGDSPACLQCRGQIGDAERPRPGDLASR